MTGVTDARGRGGSGRGRGAGRGHGGRRSLEVNPDEVLILRYGPSNNWILFRERVISNALDRFGDLGRVIEIERYYDPPAVDDTKYDLTNDPNGVNKMRLIEAHKIREKKITKMEDDRSNLFGFILKKLSRESLEEVKHHVNWAQFNSTKDVLEFWLALKDVHMTLTTSKIDSVVQKAAKDDYNNCRQNKFESIAEYKARFDARLMSYNQHGNPAISDDQVAMDFLYGLDKSRYAAFIEEILNDLAKETMKPLKDLNQIYVLAATRIVVKVNSRVTGGASFATLDSQTKKAWQWQGQWEREGKRQGWRQEIYGA